jgi:hypothetical protein
MAFENSLISISKLPVVCGRDALELAAHDAKAYDIEELSLIVACGPIIKNSL